jgi:hypothetical protein
MHLHFRKSVSLLLVASILAICFAFTVGTQPAAAATLTRSAQSASTSAATPASGINHCGIISCSYYFSRSTTHWIAQHGVLAAIGLGFVPHWLAYYLSPIVGLVNWKATQAASRNYCLRVRYGAITGLYSDNSGYCKN